MRRNHRNYRSNGVLWRRAVCVVLIVAGAFGLYRVKYRVQALQQDIAAMEHKLDVEHESLRVAAAEWAYLTRPERVQALAEKHLVLQPVDPRQMAEVSAVPYDVQVSGMQPGITPASAMVTPP